MRRAYSYVRFSKKDQANGDSLRRQVAASEAYCKRKGLQLDEGLHLHDLGMSAFQGKNADVGALGTFREAVRIGRVPKGSILIIESLDRLSRSEIDDAYDLFRELLKAGIGITTLTPEREYTKANVNDLVGLLEPLFIMSRRMRRAPPRAPACGPCGKRNGTGCTRKPLPRSAPHGCVPRPMGRAMNPSRRPSRPCCVSTSWHARVTGSGRSPTC